MQVTRATFIPLLTSAHSDRVDPSAVRDECFGELTVVYTFGPDFGRRVVTHADIDQLQLHPRMLRQSALQHLEVLSSRAEFHGQPPALMLSFEGLESSLLLANDFWSRLEGAVPGELIVGVPARDVVIVTGSRSGPGLEKAKRCVERVFFAGGENLIARGLLVRRGGSWEPFDRAARPAGRPTFGPAHQHGVGQPPGQYQEHPSWPGERVPVAAELPTLIESGLPGFDVSGWFAFFVAAKTPEAIIKKIHADTTVALADPAIKGRLEDLGIIVVGSTPEALGAHVRSEIEKWGPVIKEAGIRGGEQ